VCVCMYVCIYDNSVSYSDESLDDSGKLPHSIRFSEEDVCIRIYMYVFMYACVLHYGISTENLRGGKIFITPY
jgi:hypothetical protein